MERLPTEDLGEIMKAALVHSERIWDLVAEHGEGSGQGWGQGQGQG